MLNNNPFRVSTDITTLERLNTGDATLREMLTDPSTGHIQVGRATLDPALVGDLLDTKTPATKSVESILAGAARLEKLANSLNTRTQRLHASLERKARAALLKSTVTKSEMQFAELRDEVNELSVFNNPLGYAPQVAKTRNEKGEVFQIRLPGTAVTQLLPGETPESAVNRLRLMVMDDSKVLCSLAGMKPTDAALAAISHGVFPFRGTLPEGQAGVVVGYAISFSDVGRLLRAAKALSSVTKTIHVLDASRADSATLRLNLSPEEQIADLEADLDSLGDEPDITVDDLAEAI